MGGKEKGIVVAIKGVGVAHCLGLVRIALWRRARRSGGVIDGFGERLGIGEVVSGG